MAGYSSNLALPEKSRDWRTAIHAHMADAALAEANPAESGAEAIRGLVPYRVAEQFLLEEFSPKRMVFLLEHHKLGMGTVIKVLARILRGKESNDAQKLKAASMLREILTEVAAALPSVRGEINRFKKGIEPPPSDQDVIEGDEVFEGRIIGLQGVG